MSKRWFGLHQRPETTTSRKTRATPYVVGLASLAATMMVALAALWF
jgi:hypothetical protein